MPRPNLFASTSSRSTSQPPFSPPWEDWQLDALFLTALSDWDTKNPETTLERIFQSASLAIDQGKDLVEVIPDHPFPAKGLVKALMQLVKLGANIPGAQRELVGFAQDIIEWVDGIKISFANVRSGKFTKTTWENLARIRKLIDEICMWATLRLGDGRWSLKNVRINKEITDFKARLDHARKVFRDRSIVVISGGLDAILQKLGALLKSFDRISLTLKDIRNTQEDHYRAIIDELRDQQEAYNRRKFLKASLHPQTAEKVAYDQQEKIPCDEDTRMEVLADIRAWINDVSYGSKNFLWLTGDPGCGKSAVTASVTRECKDRKILWAQFFINRNNDETTNPNLYFPTIARQLAECSDVAERQIFDALIGKSSLLDGISREQVTRLFVDTLGVAASIDGKVPVVVVIDGLDETRRDKLEDTAIIISTFFDALAGYPNVKVFISSRTEHGIQRPFSKAMRDNRHVKNVHLDTNSESSIRDVETYLRKRFARIAEKYGYNPNLWPGEGRLRLLASHASGHFIWAVTVTRFLEEQIDEWGLERLDTVMENLGTTEGKQDIKALYGVVLHLTYAKRRDPWAFETFRRVVGVVATSLEPLSITELELLLDLKRDPLSSPVDLLHFVRRLRTVLVAGTGDITGKTILRLHKSFFEYITSNDCEDRFRVYLEISNTELAFQCLRHITEAYSVIRNAQYSSEFIKSEMIQLPNSSQLKYSLRFCASHFPKRGEKRLSTMTDDPIVHPLYLNAILCRSPGVDEGAGPLTLRYATKFSNHILFTSLDDRGLRWRVKGRWFLPENPPRFKSKRQIICSNISPMGTKIAVAFIHLSSLGSRSYRNEVEVLDAENLLHLYSVPFTYPVKSLAFSPDGKHVAVLTTNSITQVDVETGDLTVQEHRVKFDMVISLIFSPDGDLHEISNTSPSVLVRSKIGSSTKAAEMRHDAQCKFMVVSRDCTQILTITLDSVHIWDFHSGHVVQVFPSDFYIWCAAISPDKEIVICSDSLGTVYMWNTKSSQSWQKLCDVNSYLHGRYFTRQMEAWLYSGADHLSFSPGGNLIVATSHGIAHLWDCRSEKSSFLHNYPLKSMSSRHRAVKDKAQSFQCPIFSLDEEHVFLFDDDGIGKYPLLPYQRKAPPRPSKVEWTAFSPDGNFHIYAVLKNGLRLCDSRTGRTHRLPFPRSKSKSKKRVRIFCVTFSPDESRIAGISIFGDVYMWDTAHHSLLGMSAQPTWDVTSISFAVDGETIVLSSEMKAITRLSLLDGSLVHLPNEHDIPSPEGTIASAHYFDPTGCTVYGSSETAYNSRLAMVRWFPGSSNRSDVFWALVNNHIVRGGADGTFVVVPVKVK